ncbi:MAG: PAS domain-containing protein, partial [Ignavibacteriae bacterium]|nr:PAS domain-containing protein [Ignavibacteriota bacterium]
MDKSPKNPQKINKKSFEPESIQINFNELFRNANDIIFLLDTKGNLIDVNDCAINTYGYTLDEFKKFKIFDLRLPEEIELAKKQFKRVISKGTIKFESIHLKKSGEAFPVEVSTSVIKLKHKKLIQSIIRDISDRKRAEEALINSERRYQLLAENSPVGIFHTDLNGVTTYVNPRWSEISGMNGEDALGDGWLNSVHPDDKKSIISGWNNKVKSKNISNAEYRFLKKDGSVVWVIGQANPEKDDKGNVISYVGTITDITERKIAEIALQDSSENISALLNAPKDSVLIIDTNGIIIDSNEVTCKRLNRKKDKLIGNSLYEFFPNYVSQLRMQKINEAAKTGNAQYFEDVRDEYYFDNTIYPVKDSNGNVVRLVVIARDITERKLAEEELKSKEKQQSLILDSLPIIFYTSYPNKELATKWISEQIKKMTGHSQELF